MTGLSPRARILIGGITIGALLGAFAWVVVIPRLRPHAFSGAVIQSNTAAPRVDLMTDAGVRASLDDYEGKLVVLYFGYTFCPDVCPATLSTLKKGLDKMGDRAEDVQVIMVSVDPERDTPEQLAEYLDFFDPSFVGMTGTIEEVAAVSTVYGVYFEAQDGTAATGYLVDHTATLMVVDQDGFLKLVLPPEVAVDDLVSDLEYLL